MKKVFCFSLSIIIIAMQCIRISSFNAPSIITNSVPLLCVSSSSFSKSQCNTGDKTLKKIHLENPILDSDISCQEKHLSPKDFLLLHRQTSKRRERQSTSEEEFGIYTCLRGNRESIYHLEFHVHRLLHGLLGENLIPNGAIQKFDEGEEEENTRQNGENYKKNREVDILQIEERIRCTLKILYRASILHMEQCSKEMMAREEDKDRKSYEASTKEVCVVKDGGLLFSKDDNNPNNPNNLNINECKERKRINENERDFFFTFILFKDYQLQNKIETFSFFSADDEIQPTKESYILQAAGHLMQAKPRRKGSLFNERRPEMTFIDVEVAGKQRHSPTIKSSRWCIVREPLEKLKPAPIQKNRSFASQFAGVITNKDKESPLTSSDVTPVGPVGEVILYRRKSNDEQRQTVELLEGLVTNFFIVEKDICNSTTSTFVIKTAPSSQVLPGLGRFLVQEACKNLSNRIRFEETTPSFSIETSILHNDGKSQKDVRTTTKYNKDQFTPTVLSPNSHEQPWLACFVTGMGNILTPVRSISSKVLNIPPYTLPFYEYVECKNRPPEVDIAKEMKQVNIHPLLMAKEGKKEGFFREQLNQFDENMKMNDKLVEVMDQLYSEIQRLLEDAEYRSTL